MDIYKSKRSLSQDSGDMDFIDPEEFYCKKIGGHDNDKKNHKPDFIPLEIKPRRINLAEDSDFEALEEKRSGMDGKATPKSSISLDMKDIEKPAWLMSPDQMEDTTENPEPGTLDLVFDALDSPEQGKMQKGTQ